MTFLLDLDFEEIRSILSLYHLDQLVSHRVLHRQKFETLYRVDTGEQKYFLRVCTGRAFGHMVFEKDLLKYLAQQGLPVPGVEENVASGAFTPWSVDGRYVSLYRDVPGRVMGRFEFDENNCFQLGKFLGQLHSVSDGFSSRSSSKNILAVARRAFTTIRNELSESCSSVQLSVDAAELESELEEQECRILDGVRGLHHGDIKISSLLFCERELTMVRGFSECGHDRYIFDVAKAIYECCWTPDPQARQGPSGSYDASRINALVRGYKSMKNTSLEFWRPLRKDLRLAALISATRRLQHFELAADSATYFEDYRHDMSKLRALGKLGELRFET